MIENETNESREKWGGRELKKGEGKDREVRPEGKEKGRTDSGKQMCGKKFGRVEYNFCPIGLAFTPE